jgi:hypothetical protein
MAAIRPPAPRVGRFKRWLLDLDARIDHSLFARRAWLQIEYDDFSAFMDRFYVSGINCTRVIAPGRASTARG